MNKKTLIFSLSAILFLALSFIVYSWSEPTTAMPSGYTAPLNTGTTGQTKKGQLKLEGPLHAPMIYDQNNTNYYIDPSGNSIIAGKIVTDNPASAGDLPNTIVTKGYVDGLFGGNDEGGGEVMISNLIYKTGQNPDCGEGIMVMRRWDPVTCQGSEGGPGYYCWRASSCTTVPYAWMDGKDNPPSCTYTTARYADNPCYGATCTASTWSEVICAKMGDPLYGQKHTESQCNALGGAAVTVEGDVRICKFPVTTQCFKQINPYPAGPCDMKDWEVSHTRTAVYECPTGWTKYKNFVTTKSKTWHTQDIVYGYAEGSDGKWHQRVCHIDGEPTVCTANPGDERIFSNKNTIDACGVYCDTNYNVDGIYYGQAEVIEAGCY